MGNTEQLNRTCPLCGGVKQRSSIFGTTRFKGSDFYFVQCADCGSHYYDPMPGSSVLQAMYGPEYVNNAGEDPLISDPKRPEWPVKVLRARSAKSFLDYGCGTGNVLRAAREAGFDVAGVELDREVALRTQADTNCPVMTPEEALATGRSYDAIHMGDVVEHLTEPESQMRLIRSLLTANGTLLAQGPLEGNASLFIWVLKIWRRLSKPGPTDYAPFHVVLATANGQLRFFERYGFRTLEYRLVEVDWPAPSRLAQKGMTLRGALLFFLRQVSKLVSTCNPGRWGNRYYYVGAKVGERD